MMGTIRPAEPTRATKGFSPVNRRVWFAVLVMGFSGLVAEILLLRELLIVFSGNELCIGIILANWLILEALGCFLAGRGTETSGARTEAFTITTVLFSLSLPVAILLTRLLKQAIGISIGESIGFFPMLYASFLILLPVSTLHGAQFTLSCRMDSVFSGRQASSAGRVYAVETVGTIAGGIVCTALLIPHLDALTASFLLAALNGLVCLLLMAPHWKAGRRRQSALVLSSLLVLGPGSLVLTGGADRLHDASIRAQWKNQNVVHYQNSRYGNVCTLENEGQYIFFLDGVPSIMTPIPDIAFILANRISLENRPGVSRTAGFLYACDLLGGWFGGLAGAVVLLPVLGLAGTSMAVGLLKLTSFIVVAAGPAKAPKGGQP